MKSHNASSPLHLDSLDAVQAKVIVLGDQNTGKTQIIRNLDSPTRQSDGEIRNDGFFTLIEILPEELESTSSSVLLKLWEHSRGVSKQEEELAFRGALFCIITLDIRDPDSAESALNKWVKLKESLAPECFLFIVGTYLDKASHRRVDLKDICKACAKKDAVYLEVSNTTQNNISLLRKLIRQRLNYMLYRKEVIAQRPFTPASALSGDESEMMDAELYRHDHEAEEHGTEENKQNSDEPTLRRFSLNLHAVSGGGGGGGNNSHHQQNSSTAIHSAAHHTPRHISVPALEPNILCDSVGSILASHLGTEFWPGLEEEGEELEKIGWKIGNFIEQLSDTGVNEANLATASTALLDDAFSTQHNFKQSAPPVPSPSPPRSPGRQSPTRTSAPPTAAHPPPLPSDEYVDASYSTADLRSAFEIMGLPLPASLENSMEERAQGRSPGALDSGNSKVNANATTYLRKMTVKLPDGSSADMILDLDSNIEQQIELFLLSNSLADDDDARQKMISIGRNVQKKYYEKEGRPTPSHKSYHHQQRQEASSPSDSSTGNKHNSHNHLLHHIQGNIPFSNNAKRGSSSPVPSNHGLETGSNTADFQNKSKIGQSDSWKVKLRIALGGGTTAEIIYRSGESVHALTENLAGKYQLNREQSQRVFEQISRATSSL